MLEPGKYNLENTRFPCNYSALWPTKLPVPALADQLHPLAPPKSDIALEPRGAAGSERTFRDRRWRVVWAQPPATIADGLRQ